jgi:hypothetical protein
MQLTLSPLLIEIGSGMKRPGAAPKPRRSVILRSEALLISSQTPAQESKMLAAAAVTPSPASAAAPSVGTTQSPSSPSAHPASSSSSTSAGSTAAAAAQSWYSFTTESVSLFATPEGATHHSKWTRYGWPRPASDAEAQTLEAALHPSRVELVQVLRVAVPDLPLPLLDLIATYRFATALGLAHAT